MLEIPNTRVVIPTVDELNIEVPINGAEDSDFPAIAGREALTFSYTMAATTQLVLPWDPITPDSVEIYKDGIRIINESVDFGVTKLRYEIVERIVTFSQPVAGDVTAICDTVVVPPIPDEYFIEIDNRQGGETSSGEDDSTFASLYCEPVVCAQPYNGFARLSDDKQSIIYIPEVGYEGLDSFSYTVITQRGQIAEPQCIYINVTAELDPSLLLKGVLVLLEGEGVIIA